MAWTPDSPPKRAGDYTRFAQQPATVLPVSTGQIVAVPFTADWGPVRVPTLVRSWVEFLDIFGQPVDPLNPGEDYIAVYSAFRGEDDTHPGAGAVLCYRHAGTGVAKATKALKAGASDAITLTAIFEGTRGNQIRLETVANAANPSTHFDLNIYLGTVLVEQYKGYAAAGITQLQADINAKSKWVRASGAVNGAKLDAVAATALTGGNDGATLNASDWTSTMASLEPQSFGYLAPANLGDSTIAGSLATWAKNLNSAAKSKRFFTVLGGLLGETYTTASTAASTYNDENIVRVGVGTYNDSRLNQQLSTAQLAPRIAGVMAARGGMTSLSFAPLADLTIVSGPSESDILAALDGGVVVLSLGTGGVRVEKGVTTFGTKNDPAKPWETYSRIKYVTTMQSFERQSREMNESGNKLGRLPVNNETREQIIADEQALLDQFVERGEIQPGAKVSLTSGVISDDDEHIGVDWVGKFGRALEQIRRTVYMS